MKPENERRLDEFRALRNRAWELFEEDVQQLRHDLSDKTIFERVKDRAELELHEAVDYAKDVAAANKPVVIGTIALLVAWFLRGPIGDAFDALLGKDEAEPDGARNVDADKGDNP